METRNNIPLVTLITDFGYQDGFVGVMKGVMFDICPNIQIVDISHEIPAHDIDAAAFVLGQAYAYFPENSLHVIVVDPGVGGPRNILYVEAGYYRFLAPDNGVLKYVCQWENIYRVIHVTNSDYYLPEQSHTFHGRDIFASVAAHLVKGINPAVLGQIVKDHKTQKPPDPVIEGKHILGEIIYIDHFGNLISNISQELLSMKIRENQQFIIMLAGHKITDISDSFISKPVGNLLAYIDSSEFIAFAINGQNAAQKMGLSVGDRFEIQLSE